MFSSISLHGSLKKAFYLSLLFLGTLHSDGYIFPFLLCLLLLFFSQQFVRPSQTAVLTLCISFSFSSTSLLLLTHLPPSSCMCTQSCNPMNCSLPGASVHGSLQARVLEWIAISFSMHFFFLGMVLITASCIKSQTSIHSSSGTLSTRSNPLNLFITSTV